MFILFLADDRAIVAPLSEYQEQEAIREHTRFGPLSGDSKMILSPWDGYEVTQYCEAGYLPLPKLESVVDRLAHQGGMKGNIWFDEKSPMSVWGRSLIEKVFPLFQAMKGAM